MRRPHHAPRLACLALLLATACSKPGSAPAPHAAAQAADAAAASAPAPASAPDPEELARKALAHVPQVLADVARLRGLEAPRVAAERQGQKDFQAYLLGELTAELPEGKSQKVSQALYALGLLREPIDLLPVLKDAYLSQAGAYYDPQTKKFFLVMVPRNEQILDMLSAHELDHAIVDGAYDLTAYLGGRGNSAGLSEDERAARQFVVEGEATLVMTAYLAGAVAKVDMLAPRTRPQLRAQLAAMARMDPDKLAQMTMTGGAGAFFDMGPDIEKSIEAMKDIPPYVMIPLLDAYMKGAVAVLEVYDAGGWPAVDRLYREPPDSTEQMLHPADKLLAGRDYPVTVTLPTPPALRGWTLLHSDVMGELLWRVYFHLWAPADMERASAGWDGDRYAVYAKGDRTVALVETVWDSADEAREFADAYRAAAGKRGAQVAVEQAGDRVHVVGGCDAAQCPALLKALARARVTRDARDHQ